MSENLNTASAEGTRQETMSDEERREAAFQAWVESLPPTPDWLDISNIDAFGGGWHARDAEIAALRAEVADWKGGSETEARYGDEARAEVKALKDILQTVRRVLKLPGVKAPYSLAFAHGWKMPEEEAAAIREMWSRINGALATEETP